MFQFSEILTLALGLVLLTYLAAHWRRILGATALGPFVGPILLLIFSWVCTVAEGVFLQNVPFENLIVVHQPSVGLPGQAGDMMHLLNWLEHISGAAAGVWLLVSMLQLRRSRREAAP